MTHVVITMEVSIFHTSHQYVPWVSLFRVTVLFEMFITVTSELFERIEYLMLYKSIHYLIVKIKHKMALHITKHHTLA